MFTLTNFSSTLTMTGLAIRAIVVLWTSARDYSQPLPIRSSTIRQSHFRHTFSRRNSLVNPNCLDLNFRLLFDSSCSRQLRGKHYGSKRIGTSLDALIADCWLIKLCPTWCSESSAPAHCRRRRSGNCCDRGGSFLE